MKPVPFLPIRNTVYPQSNVKRFPVPDHLVSWMVKYADYLPEFYESANIHGKPYADPPIGLSNDKLLNEFFLLRFSL